MRMVSQVLFLVFSLTCFSSLNSASAANKSPRLLKSTYDFSAPLVKPENARGLQKALDKFGRVRLLPGNYKSAGTIKLKSKQIIYGLPGTSLNGIDVLPGTKYAALYGLRAKQLTFRPGAPISYNTFFRIEYTTFTSIGASLSDNLFLGFLWTKIHIDNSKQGYFRNNRFIRTTVHSVYPQLVLKGNPKRPDDSHGNVFLWFNFLTAGGNTSWIENQKDLSLVGVDSESWNWHKKGGNPLFHTGKMGTLRLFAAQGGNQLSSDKYTALLGSDAEKVIMLGTHVSQRKLKRDNVLLGADNKSFLMLGSSPYTVSNSSSESVRFTGISRKQQGLRVNNEKVAITPDQARELSSMVWDKDRKGTPWGQPEFEEIKPLAEKSWRLKAKTAEDSSAKIQAMIDKDGIALLKPGTYYLGSPLIIRSKNGLIGSGKDKTILIAKDPTMDLIKIRPNNGKNQAFSIGHLSLVGGATGLACRKMSHRISVTNGYFSHINFRDMSHAGILTEKIYTWDNNLIDHVSFINCKNGVLQITDPTWTGGGEENNVMFLDKNFWYRCQFISCDLPLNLKAHRANNLNAYYECNFSDSKNYVANLYNNLTSLFANCVFNKNGGSPMIQGNLKNYFVSCQFTPKTSGQSFFGTPVDLEGCTFDTGSKKNCRLIHSSHKNPSTIINCKAGNVNADKLVNGIAINSTLRFKNVALKNSVVLFSPEGNKVLTKEKSKPTPQLLFGAEW